MKPLDDLVLGMKAFGIEEIKNFPFVTLPDEEALTNAEKLCVKLGALKRPHKRQISGERTFFREIQAPTLYFGTG